MELARFLYEKETITGDEFMEISRREGMKNENRSGFGWLEFIIGVILIALGVFTFASPGAALTGFAVAYGVIAVVMGVADIVLYVRMFNSNAIWNSSYGGAVYERGGMIVSACLEQ